MPLPRLTLALAILTGATLLAPAIAGAEEVLRVSGTGTALGALRRLAPAFAKAAPGHRLAILPSVGSGGAFKAVAKGALELGISARPLTNEEYALGLVAFPYARTPFLFAAGPRAGAKDLSGAEAARILRGEVTTWPNGERLRLILRPRTDADTAILKAISPELSDAVDRALARDGMLLAITNQESNELLVRTPGALGLSSLTQILTEALVVTPLSWNGVAPTVSNMVSGAYPLQKTLYVVVKAPASAAVKRFVGFLASPAARSILEQAGNAPLAVPPFE